MKLLIICWLVAFFSAAPAHATGCKVAVRKNVVQAVIVQKAVAVQAIAAVAVPAVNYGYGQALYGATYQPDGLTEAFKVLLQQNQDLIRINTTYVEELRRTGRVPPPSLTAPMPGAEGQGAGAGQQGAGAPDAEIVQLFGTHCAACHDGTVSKTKGKGLTLLTAGRLADLTPDQNAAVISALASGSMPKGKPLSAEARLKFIETLTK